MKLYLYRGIITDELPVENLQLVKEPIWSYHYNINDKFKGWLNEYCPEKRTWLLRDIKLLPTLISMHLLMES